MVPIYICMHIYIGVSSSIGISACSLPYILIRCLYIYIYISNAHWYIYMWGSLVDWLYFIYGIYVGFIACFDCIPMCLLINMSIFPDVCPYIHTYACKPSGMIVFPTYMLTHVLVCPLICFCSPPYAYILVNLLIALFSAYMPTYMPVYSWICLCPHMYVYSISFYVYWYAFHSTYMPIKAHLCTSACDFSMRSHMHICIYIRWYTPISICICLYMQVYTSLVYPCSTCICP